MFTITKSVARLSTQGYFAAIATQGVRRCLHAEAKLKSMGYNLQPTAPVGNHLNVMRTGNTVYISGHIAKDATGNTIVGKIPTSINEDKGYEAARLAMLSLLGTLKNEIGDLDRVLKVLKVTGMVNSTPEFVNHTKVMNGASDLLKELYGVTGNHCRMASGVTSLPHNAPVELDMIVEILPHTVL